MQPIRLEIFCVENELGNYGTVVRSLFGSQGHWKYLDWQFHESNALHRYTTESVVQNPIFVSNMEVFLTYSWDQIKLDKQIEFLGQVVSSSRKLDPLR